MFKKKNLDDWLDHQGERCPYCGGRVEVHWSRRVVAEDTVYFECACMECFKSFSNAYRLTNPVLHGDDEDEVFEDWIAANGIPGMREPAQALGSVDPEFVEIQTIHDLYDYLGVGNHESFDKVIYAHTACGAWGETLDDGIRVGSIIEGVDQTTTEYTLRFPFSASEFEDVITCVEDEAKEIWNKTHGCPTCRGHWISAGMAEDGDHEHGNTPIWGGCPDCGGGGDMI